MTSSVTQIELSPVRDVRTDDTTLTVELADGRSIRTPMAWYPRLAYGTAQERANWRPIADGEGIHWPDLDEDISIEGLLAGRRSGEGAASLKRWTAIQDQLRRMPADLRGLRREVLLTGKLPLKELVRRVWSTIEAYDSEPGDWSVGVVADPFDHLSQHHMNESSACAVYQAESANDASKAKSEVISRGARESASESVPDDAAYVCIFSEGTSKTDAE
jgi:Protein of unknown function (DUF2442)